MPLRALIPPRINNLLVTGKNIATSHIAAAAYRVHPYEWSVGAGTGTVAAYVLEQGLRPHQLTEPLPLYSPHLVQVQRRLQAAANPIAFPDNF
ncbi:FAD-dependent oxidoreductase [Parathermosynechococcus lividus]|uniref:FAD-dependent oxidoreductase n=1 Tax=Parathermosynechococcus lividus TaxID=33070 RepID=UPI001F1CAE39|nr:FAD-dependent oxidoreductase [Thermostichus lividus]